MSTLLFDPWIGENYGKSELGRLLIVGESHYFYHKENDYKNFTKKIIGNLGSSSDNEFYRKIGQIFNQLNYLDVWNKVAFANAIQFPYELSRQKITKEQFKTVEPAILEYLNLTRPTKLIVFSKRIWDHGISGNIDWGKYIETIHDEQFKKSATVWRFHYDKKCCYGIGIHHTSSTRPLFKSEEWRPLVSKFLSKQYTCTICE